MDSNLSDVNILKILLKNANGLKENETDFLHLLLENQISIALITEIYCKPNSKLYFSVSKVYKADHPNGRTVHTGSTVIMSSKI